MNYSKKLNLKFQKNFLFRVPITERFKHQGGKKSSYKIKTLVNQPIIKDINNAIFPLISLYFKEIVLYQYASL